jgi:tRNA-splicing ligase RtcB
VFATEHEIVPSALGGDLGCGMSALRIADAVPERAVLEKILEALERAIPAGLALHRGRGVDVPSALFDDSLSTRALDHAREALARRHLGTLGGGNHFLELDRDAEGALYLLVHTGSRGLGAAIFDHHARVVGARATAPNGERAALDVREETGDAYARDLAWALSFARANRTALARRALEIIADFVPVGEAETIDIHHNFVAKERWLDRDLYVHRKGAVAVPHGTRALVPGSMGTASYIVEGLGCADAFGSCSHGAGRVMTRKEARAAVAPRALESMMRNVVYSKHLERKLVEEAPAAYRDIREVLAEQEDLVVRRTRLEPVLVLKR